MSDASGQTTYTYNERDWLTNKTWTPALPQVAPSSLSLNYAYDLQGNLLGIRP